MMSFSCSSSTSSTSTPHPQPEQKKKPKLEAEADAEPVYELIPSLPNDVALNCLARVPCSQHQTLSMVSKAIRSLLSSPLFFNTRSLLHSTEHLLYITTSTFDNSLQWFTLSRNPNVLVPLSVPPIPPPSPSIGAAAFAVLGPNIYVIGGSICKIPSPRVWVLDCRFNRWRPGPTMLVSRGGAVARVVDGKIYVIGGCEAGSTIWAEVLDPAVGRWVEVPCPFASEPWRRRLNACGVVDDIVYVNVNEGLVAFDPRNGAWKRVERMFYLSRGGTVVVDGILYCNDVWGKIRGLDVRRGVWKELKGLDQSLPRMWGRITLAYVGGKLLVFWGYRGRWNGDEKSEIWCAEIELSKSGDAELWGKVCWCQNIAVPRPCFVMRCSSVVL